ncbi:MAG: hypothetical protein ACKVRP_15805, partial [Bacteroidota bacterium]
TPTPTVTTITPTGLNGGTSTGGFVRGIAVDPTNSNNVLVCFGNYNFQSVWYSTNGGSSWTDVEGNLAGPTGPSIRFASIFHINGEMQVFLATSVGVLSTTSLNGSSTVWVQEGANEIGNILTGYLDYRPSDQTLAVGTHARGVFTTQFMSLPSLAVSVGAGWNMLSDPMNTPNDSIGILFPAHVPPAYSYSPGVGYEPANDMVSGTGYWMKFQTDAVVSISGEPIDSLDVQVQAGWNLIGAVSSPVATGAIIQTPSNNVVSEYYEFNPTGYLRADTLYPGKAYWVKVAGGGELRLVTAGN